MRTEKQKAARRAYYRSPKGRAATKAFEMSPKRRAYRQGRRRSPERLAAVRKYQTSVKGVASRKRQRSSEKTRMAKKKWHATPEGQACARRSQLKNLYGITEKDYEKLFISQNGACAICSSVSLNGKRLHVDHDHTTKKIRGLLCHHCNGLLGHARERIIVLYKAADYLELHGRIACRPS